MISFNKEFVLGVLVLAGLLIVDMLHCDEQGFREESDAFLARLI